MLSLLAIYLGVGCVAGLLAGLLGLGGGLVIVPMLGFCFQRQGGIPPSAVMHLALATSMASIMFTAVSSAWAHHRRGAVDWTVVGRIIPGVFFGTFLGSYVASRLSTGFLKAFFVAFLIYVATQMLVGRKPAASRQLPGWPGMLGVGSAIGVVSSLVGIGGGTLSVPFMLWCNLAVHRAIGTSAAIGLPIAVGGTIGYLVNGLRVPDLPPYSVGYIYLPALVGIVCASVLMAPVGVRLAHRLPVALLKRIFAVLLLVVAARMLWGLLAS